MATRLALIRAVRQKEERQQIGALITPFAQALLHLEKQCLVHLSEAARSAGQVQIALNSIIRAQRLETVASFEVAQEFACVLWLQKEEKLAVQYLEDLHLQKNIGNADRAISLSRLVCAAYISSANHLPFI